MHKKWNEPSGEREKEEHQTQEKEATSRHPTLCLKEVRRLESGLLALEATTAATAAAETTTATATATTATAAEATTTAAATTESTATAATTATEAATTTAAATEAAALTGRLGGRVVQTDVAASARLAVESLESLLGILQRVEGNVAETLGATRLPVIG